jgi:voltage-gated potassium channel Kch
VVVVVAAALVRWTDPDLFPDLGTGVWWAVSTVTTVGYGDIVPASGEGRVVAGLLMFVGIASFAFLTAVAASVIVVGEVADEEREIQRAVEQEDSVILERLQELSATVERLEATLRAMGEAGRFRDVAR